jgi:hypothetical protein
MAFDGFKHDACTAITALLIHGKQLHLQSM